VLDQFGFCDCVEAAVGLIRRFGFEVNPSGSIRSIKMIVSAELLMEEGGFGALDRCCHDLDQNVQAIGLRFFGRLKGAWDGGFAERNTCAAAESHRHRRRSPDSGRLA